MQLKTILALTDLQPQCLTGLRAGYAIAEQQGAKLVVGHVLVPRTLGQANVKEFLEANGLDPETVTIDIEVDEGEPVSNGTLPYEGGTATYEITVDDALLMRLGQGVGKRYREIEKLLERQTF